MRYTCYNMSTVLTCNCELLNKGIRINQTLKMFSYECMNYIRRLESRLELEFLVRIKQRIQFYSCSKWRNWHAIYKSNLL